jgi:hypothetical protein
LAGVVVESVARAGIHVDAVRHLVFIEGGAKLRNPGVDALVGAGVVLFSAFNKQGIRRRLNAGVAELVNATDLKAEEAKTGVQDLTNTFPPYT